VAVPEVANAFASSLLPRLSDEGVSVRKKTVRIFHEILISNPTFRSRATVCAFMLRRASDPKEDDSVRDLIHALFAGLWLGGEIVELPLFEESIAPSLNDVPYVIPNRETGVVTPNSKGSTEEQELCKVPAVRPNMESNMQVRCRIASEQMIEVVAAANSKDVLLSLLRDLLFGLTDSDKDRKASEREKRKQNAIAHCSHLVDALFEHLLSLEETRSGDQGVFTQTLVAMLRTIGVFAEVTPTYVLRHIQTLLPYLKADNGVTNSVECDIVSEVCDTVYACSSVMPFMEYRELCEASIAHDFISITYRFGSSALSSSIRALSGLANHPEATVDSVFAKQLKKVATTFYGYLLKNLTLMKDVVPVNASIHKSVDI
jgi:cohesin loading factor subunit SCC2